MHEINDSPRYKPNQRIHLSLFIPEQRPKQKWIFYPELNIFSIWFCFLRFGEGKIANEAGVAYLAGWQPRFCLSTRSVWIEVWENRNSYNSYRKLGDFQGGIWYDQWTPFCHYWMEGNSLLKCPGMFRASAKGICIPQKAQGRPKQQSWLLCGFRSSQGGWDLELFPKACLSIVLGLATICPFWDSDKLVL